MHYLVKCIVDNSKVKIYIFNNIVNTFLSIIVLLALYIMLQENTHGTPMDIDFKMTSTVSHFENLK